MVLVGHSMGGLLAKIWRRRASPGGSDDIVPYASAHLEGAASELLITGWRLCQDHPQLIGQVRRILAERGRSPDRLPPPTAK
jgi:hypothetical protein